MPESGRCEVMGCIKAAVSAVMEYEETCEKDYADLLNLAAELLSRTEKMHGEVQTDYESISRQALRARALVDEIERRVKAYEFQMNAASSEADAYAGQASYLRSHPTVISSTDSEGNVTTSAVYDEAGIRDAERNYDRAMGAYNDAVRRRDEAFAAYTEAMSVSDYFNQIRDAIYAVAESIQSGIYEIKKYLRLMEDEASFNLQSLRAVISRLQSYLESQAVFLPAGAEYRAFFGT